MQTLRYSLHIHQHSLSSQLMRRLQGKRSFWFDTYNMSAEREDHDRGWRHGTQHGRNDPASLVCLHLREEVACVNLKNFISQCWNPWCPRTFASGSHLTEVNTEPRSISLILQKHCWLWWRVKNKNPGWERSLGETEYTYMYGSVPLLFTWNHHNIVNQL